jgi:DNA-binding MarR family transcriptional regulator
MPSRRATIDPASVEDALVRIGRSISEGRDGIAAREGTTPLGADLLLLAREPRPQGELAEALGITEPRLSILASKLVDRKLLRRRTTKGDKRFRILELTASGRATAKRIETARAKLAPLGALSDTQLRQLAKALDVIDG